LDARADGRDRDPQDHQKKRKAVPFVGGKAELAKPAAAPSAEDLQELEPGLAWVEAEGLGGIKLLVSRQTSPLLKRVSRRQRKLRQRAQRTRTAPRARARSRERREQRHVARSTSSSDGGDSDPPGEPPRRISFDPPPTAPDRWRWVSEAVVS
jgi:hypothetical protein